MRIKILIDANIFVSSLINPKGFPAKIISAWLEEKFDCLISIPLLEEISEVLRSPRIKIKYGLSDEEIDKFLQLIAQRSQEILVARRFKLCRHPKDDLILETAINGQAKYFITRDDDIKRDLKLIHQLESRGITVLSVRLFLDRLSKNTL